MKIGVLIAALGVLLCGTAWGNTYMTDFEGDAPGTLPAGWYVATPWGSWADGPITAEVAAAPGGGQALEVVWGTDFASYAAAASSGETGYTLDMSGIDGANAQMHVEFDFWKENWRVWQVFGDQTWFPPGGLHMSDDPLKPNWMYVGRDGGTTADLSDVPGGAWIHVEMDFDSSTDAWSTTVSYASGSGGGTFNGTSANDIAGECWFGGWAFQSTMDMAPAVPYDNVLYIDNFLFTVVPEPSSLVLLAVAGLAVRRRRPQP
jgi:hypothetical protein